MFSSDVQREMLYSGPVFTQSEMVGMLIFNHIHFIIYTSLAIALLFKYKEMLEQVQSTLKGTNLKWVIFISSGLIINWGFHFLNSFLWTVGPDLPILQIMDYRPILIGTAFIFSSMLVFKSLQKPDFLSDLILTNNAISLSKEEMKSIQNRINNYMTEKKAYLDPNFNIKMLSDNVNEKHYIVSKVLNQYKQQNFHDFTNEYRIREAQVMLLAPEFKKKNITEIMYECGFNTKSVFNAAFKKQIGMPPRQFRNYDYKSISKSA